MLAWESKKTGFKSGREEKVSEILPEQAGDKGQCWQRSGSSAIGAEMGKREIGVLWHQGKQLKDRITCCSLVLGNQRKRGKRKIL